MLETRGDELTVSADDTGSDVVYAAFAPDEVMLGLDVGEILLARRTAGRSTDICATSLSHLLHDGQVPFPDTIFEDVYALALGDRATVNREGNSLAVSFDVEFPYLASLSRQDESADTERLLRLLADSVSRRLEGRRDVVLLMSAGKDSVALALALAECGRTDVRCVTYTSEGDDEHVYASEFCRRLGLPHSTVSLDACADIADEALLRFFTESPLPGGDLAQIPVALVLASTLDPGGTVIEGSGNDAPFGYLPRKKDRIAAALTVGRWDWIDGLRSAVPPGSQVDYLMRDPAEVNWPGLRLRHAETSRLFPGAVNTSRVWRQFRRQHPGMDAVDMRGLLRGRHFEIGCQRQKVDLAAVAYGLEAVYPYQDGPLLDYYFNLPEETRYDRRRMVSKLLLRELLRSRLEYDDRTIGKRGFRFDGAAFVRGHRDLVRDEIGGCDLLDRSAREQLLRAMDIVDSRRYAWHHIVGLFQFAAWHNHSRYLDR